MNAPKLAEDKIYIDPLQWFVFGILSTKVSPFFDLINAISVRHVRLVMEQVVTRTRKQTKPLTKNAKASTFFLGRAESTFMVESSPNLQL